MRRLTWRFLAVACLLAVSSSCSLEGPAAGDAWVQLEWQLPGSRPPIRGLLTGIVDAVRVTVRFEGEQLAQATFDYELYQGRVDDIPAGEGRVFFAEALSGDTVVYNGTSEQVTIVADQVITVAIDMSPAYDTDIYPPAAVTDLQGEAQGTDVSLTWTAPGDDGLVGQAASYDLRWLEEEISEANFDAANPVAGLPAPAPSRDPESFTATGFAPGTTVYFALRTADDDQNASALSNNAVVTISDEEDTVAPAAIADLRVDLVTETTVTIAWTAPGDDGEVGTVAQYDVRFDTSPIDDASFDAASSAAGPVSPLAAGETELVTIDGLIPDTTYYFAVKAADEIPNWSALSNVVDATPAPLDITPPQAVSDLAAQEVGETTVTLTWTAPGDDGTDGTVFQYDIRWSIFPIDDSSFAGASTFPGPGLPVAGGMTETLVVDGLGSGVTYYFAIKASDEVPNWSGISNVITATPQVIDVTPPAAVTDLAVSGVDAQSLSLSWTAPGDDDTLGSVAAYDIRMSETEITELDFDSALQVTGPASPVQAGLIETVDVPDLTPGTTYYFALKALDEAGNLSPMSNVAVGVTLDDIPPANISDLITVDVTEFAVTLGWTAPGDDVLTGTVTDYDIRYDTSPITGANFDTATQAPGPQNPVPAGQAETVVVGGLTPANTYFFAVKAVDDVGNWSGISNVVDATPDDYTAPGTVTDLAETASDASSVTLGWSAPGDDGSTGTADSYEIRYSQGVIDAGNFGAAALWPSPPVPEAAGTAQSVTIGGLQTGIQYTFALKATDNVGNVSDMSNVVVVLPGQADVVAPEPVSDLATGEVSETTVELTWTASGDDGAVGTASSYDIRYSTSVIDAANFDSAQQATGPSQPASSGLPDAVAVTGLTMETTYYFALKVIDDAANPSPMSNVASVTTADFTVPDAVADLAVASLTETSATLSWTATGDNGGTGTVAEYDVRYSTSPITDADFDTASQAPGPASPVAGGQPESVTVSGLAGEVTYYFAVKAIDDAGNPSAISNVASGVTPDETAPADVTDLAVPFTTEISATLSWTAPGDSGNTGTVADYDIRYSGSPITAANFDAATAAPAPAMPVEAGQQETTTVNGLTLDTTYYFALKAVDEAGNWSGISNVPSVTTADNTPPADVTDLGVINLTATSLTLTWTAPGDNGLAGTVTDYDIRRSTAPIDDANFTAATQIGGPASPLPGGQLQTLQVTGLIQETTYHFALKAVDNEGNWSGISNIASASTPDPFPPDDVIDLVVQQTNDTSVVLGWTATGDDGASGTVAGYDVRVSTALITAANFQAAQQVPGPSNPVAPGQAESVTVSNLNRETAYYFAIKANDDGGNQSGMSNVVNTTTPDTTAPAGVTDLSVANATGNSVTLQWTAPGDDDFDGTVTAYDVRYSTSVITAANFDAATAATPPASPVAGGQTESLDITGLQPDTTYYFALKASDNIPNTSVMSNVATIQTPDPYPPDDITDLLVDAVTHTTVTLAWTAPGDDGSSGTVSDYDVRTSTSLITAANFASAIQVPGPVSPVPAGQAETVTVGGLIENTTYYFAVKAVDNSGNWSGISNVISGTPIDTTPPGDITDLAVTGSTADSVTLGWSSPGDNGMSGGKCDVYDIRYSTAPIDETNWDTATVWPNNINPRPVGQSETETITGLGAGTYYFRIKAGDEVPNWSGLSNQVSQTL